MTKKSNELIKDYRKGDDEQFLLITERFKPTVLTYSGLLYQNEAKDTITELNLSLLEAVCAIKNIDDEEQCCIILNNALHKRYLELRIKKARSKQVVFEV